MREFFMERTESRSFWLDILKGTLFSLCISLGLILILAVFLSFASLSDTAITITDQFIKIISVFLGVFIVLRKNAQHGLYKGIIIGVLFTIIAFLVFSLLDLSFSIGISLLLDLLFSVAVGAICGVICANLKK